MHVFEIEVVWQHGKECQAKARENPTLLVATPPGFGGPQGVWSPEELLVASVGSCLLSTFLYFADRFELSFSSYSSTSKGTVDKTPEGLRFTGIDVSIQVTFAHGKAAEKVSLAFQPNRQSQTTNHSRPKHNKKVNLNDSKRQPKAKSSEQV